MNESEYFPTSREQIAARQQPTQPAPDGGEWSVFEHYNRRILDSKGVLVAETQTEERATQIVADHNAMRKLVEALQEAIKEIESLIDILEDFHGPSSRPNLTLAMLRETLDAATTTPPDAGEGQ